jgi:hypothetical protein
MRNIVLPGAALLALALTLALGACTSAPSLSFFVTSANPGNGANLGGLAGADAYCQALGTSAGAGARRWRAYLSATPANGQPAVNARDRIGRGPWYNAKLQRVAKDIDELHGDNHLTKATVLTEKGEIINGVGDTPNTHDVLTGSMTDGRASTASGDTTCGNWTKGGEGSALLGHADRLGLRDDPPSHSWNSSHPSRGCDMASLRATGGAGRLYCFAAD